MAVLFTANVSQKSFLPSLVHLSVKLLIMHITNSPVRQAVCTFNDYVVDAVLHIHFCVFSRGRPIFFGFKDTDNRYLKLLDKPNTLLKCLCARYGYINYEFVLVNCINVKTNKQKKGALFDFFSVTGKIAVLVVIETHHNIAVFIATSAICAASAWKHSSALQQVPGAAPSLQLHYSVTSVLMGCYL